MLLVILDTQRLSSPDPAAPRTERPSAMRPNGDVGVGCNALLGVLNGLQTLVMLAGWNAGKAMTELALTLI